MDRKQRNRLIQRFIFIGIGVVILIGLIYRVGLQNIKDNLAGADPFLIVLAFIFFVSVMLIKIVRWSTLFPQVSFLNAGKIFSIGQIINETAPIGTGELTRGFVANTKFNIPYGKTLAPALIERISDVTFLFVLTLMFVFVVFTGESYLFIMVFLIVLLTVVYLFLFRPQYLDKFAVKLEKFGEKRRGFIKRAVLSLAKFLKTFKDALLKFHKRRAVLGYTVGLTIFAWVIEAFGQWTLIQAFGVGFDINILAFITLVSATWIIGTFSFLPGGLGVRETVFAFLLFELYAISTDIGGTIAIVYRLLNYTMLISFALISFATLPKDKMNENTND